MTIHWIRVDGFRKQTWLELHVRVLLCVQCISTPCQKRSNPCQIGALFYCGLQFARSSTIYIGTLMGLIKPATIQT